MIRQRNQQDRPPQVESHTCLLRTALSPRSRPLPPDPYIIHPKTPNGPHSRRQENADKHGNLPNWAGKAHHSPESSSSPPLRGAPFCVPYPNPFPTCWFRGEGRGGGNISTVTICSAVKWDFKNACNPSICYVTYPSKAALRPDKKRKTPERRNKDLFGNPRVFLCYLYRTAKKRQGKKKKKETPCLHRALFRPTRLPPPLFSPISEKKRVLYSNPRHTCTKKKRLDDDNGREGGGGGDMRMRSRD